MEEFPLNLNDTFTSTRGCAEPMLPMCQLKVKVTVKDARSVSLRSELFTSYILTIFKQRNLLPLIRETAKYSYSCM